MVAGGGVATDDVTSRDQQLVPGTPLAPAIGILVDKVTEAAQGTATDNVTRSTADHSHRSPAHDRK